jgi:hypothetical protein
VDLIFSTFVLLVVVNNRADDLSFHLREGSFQHLPSSIYLSTLFNWVKHLSVCSRDALPTLRDEPKAMRDETPVFLTLTFRWLSHLQ